MHPQYHQHQQYLLQQQQQYQLQQQQQQILQQRQQMMQFGQRSLSSDSKAAMLTNAIVASALGGGLTYQGGVPIQAKLLSGGSAAASFGGPEMGLGVSLGLSPDSGASLMYRSRKSFPSTSADEQSLHEEIPLSYIPAHLAEQSSPGVGMGMGMHMEEDAEPVLRTTNSLDRQLLQQSRRGGMGYASSLNPRPRPISDPSGRNYSPFQSPVPFQDIGTNIESSKGAIASANPSSVHGSSTVSGLTMSQRTCGVNNMTQNVTAIEQTDNSFLSGILSNFDESTYN
jgi:hypothetical protein